MIDVVVFLFLLGIFARLIESELRLPEALYEALSIYLLLAIGLKGGVELSKQSLPALLPQVVVTVMLSFFIPFALYPLFRALRLPSWDSAALGAHFGSVSIVTFAVVTSTLTRAGIAFESHAALWAALMEVPGLVAGVLLARLFGRAEKGASSPPTRIRWAPLVHEVLCGKSVLLLLGGLAIGAVAGVEGIAPIAAVFVDPFKGLLALFLLDLGLLAGGRLPEVRRFGWRVIVIGVGVPPLLAIVGALAGAMLGLSAGGIAVIATLAATASYIAAPTAMRLSVPQANPALSITIALGITFPFNLVIGIPLYIRLGAMLAA